MKPLKQIGFETFQQKGNAVVESSSLATVATFQGFQKMPSGFHRCSPDPQTFDRFDFCCHIFDISTRVVAVCIVLS